MGTDELNRWRDALIVDRDDALIGAAKRWLGPVKTPFNKHELVAQVEAFLRRPATGDAVIGLLDRTDKLLIALAMYSGTSVHGGLPPAELARLAVDEPAFEASALERIRNLKERLVLYTYHGPRGRDHVAIAPPLAERLTTVITPSDALSMAKLSEEPDAADPFASFCAILSACVHSKPAFKGKKEPSKRATEILEAAAPGLSADKERFLALLGALESSGAFGLSDDGRPIAYPERFVELCDEAGPSAPLALAAGCSSMRVPTNHVAAANDRKIAPGVLRAVLEALPRRLAFYPGDLRRLTAMAIRRHLEPLADSGLTAAQESLDVGLIASVAAVSDALVKLGFVVLGDEGLVRATCAIDSTLHPRTASAQAGIAGHTVVVEESHEVRVLPEATPETRAFIAAISRLDRTGLVWSSTLDKAAAKAAYASGFTAAGIASRLELVSGLPLPQSVRFSLDAWEAEVRSARLRVGVVVALDGHLSGVLEHSPKAVGLVLERLAEGVYLLAARDAPEAERLLKAAGIDVDMRPEPPDDGSETRPLWNEALAAFQNPAPAPAHEFRPFNEALAAEEAPLVKKLLAALDDAGRMPDERAELETRIKARLVLDPGELQAPVPVEDETVVTILDYSGKVRLLDRALKDGVAVELTYLDPQGVRAEATGIPRDIRRTSIGTVVALSSGAAEQTVVAIVAIESVRRLKTT